LARSPDKKKEKREKKAYVANPFILFLIQATQPQRQACLGHRGPQTKQARSKRELSVLGKWHAACDGTAQHTLPNSWLQHRIAQQ